MSFSMIDCRCQRCGLVLGRVANIWTQVGKTYFLPLVPPERRLCVQPQGKARLGDPATLVEGCELQDIACQGCQTTVGTECLSAPTNHVLDAHHVLLRRSSFTVAQTDGGQVELHVTRSLELRGSRRESRESRELGRQSDVKEEASTTPSASAPPRPLSAAPARLAHMQTQIETQRADIERIDSAGFQVVAAMDSAVRRMSNEVAGLQETLRGLCRDMSELQADRARRAQELEALKSERAREAQEMAALQADIASGAQEMAALQADMAELRRQRQQDREEQEAATTAPAFGPHELDILTHSIAAIGSRTSQVEMLQMECALLKGRVQRLEGRGGGDGDGHGQGEPRQIQPTPTPTPSAAPTPTPALANQRKRNREAVPTPSSHSDESRKRSSPEGDTSDYVYVLSQEATAAEAAPKKAATGLRKRASGRQGGGRGRGRGRGRG